MGLNSPDICGDQDKVCRAGLFHWVNRLFGVPLFPSVQFKQSSSQTHLTGPPPIGVVTVPVFTMLDDLLGGDKRSLEVILVRLGQFLTTRLPRCTPDRTRIARYGRVFRHVILGSQWSSIPNRRSMHGGYRMRGSRSREDIEQG